MVLLPLQTLLLDLDYTSLTPCRATRRRVELTTRHRCSARRCCSDPRRARTSGQLYPPRWHRPCTLSFRARYHTGPWPPHHPRKHMRVQFGESRPCSLCPPLNFESDLSAQAASNLFRSKLGGKIARRLARSNFKEPKNYNRNRFKSQVLWGYGVV